MKMIMRILANIKWAIFNHPPTSIVADLNPDSKCDYCSNTKSLVSKWLDGKRIYTICPTCTKDALDNALKGDHE